MKKLTRSDVYHLLIVSVPLLILASMFALAFASRRYNQAVIEEQLQLVSGLEDPTAPDALAVWIEKHTEKDIENDWYKLAIASMAIESVSAFPRQGQFSLLVPPSQSWEGAKHYERLAAAARPLVERMKLLETPREPIWRPLDYDSFSLGVPVKGLGVHLDHLFPELVDAYHKGDTERAVETIELGHRLFGPGADASQQNPIFYHNFLWFLIRYSLSDNVWSPEDLVRLQLIFAPEFDWETAWRTQITLDALMLSPWLHDRFRSQRYRRDVASADLADVRYINSAKSTHVPSDSLSIVRKYADAWKFAVPAGTASHADLAARSLMRGNAGELTSNSPIRDFHFDQWLKLPSLNSDDMDGDVGSYLPGLANNLLTVAVDQRYTRTAIALKQYQMKYAAWPETLEQLSRVGLSLAATVGSQDKPFFYRVNRATGTATLGKLPYELTETPDQESGSLNWDTIELE